MRPWCIHFGGEKNAKNIENSRVKTSKQQQTILFLRVPGILKEKTDRRKNKSRIIRVSEIPRPGRYSLLHQAKKQKKKKCTRTSMPAEYWHVHVSYICGNSIPPPFFVHSGMGRCVVSLSCVVEYPCLASPGPSRSILSQLGSLACVVGF